MPLRVFSKTIMGCLVSFADHRFITEAPIIVKHGLKRYWFTSPERPYSKPAVPKIFIAILEKKKYFCSKNEYLR